MERESRGTFLSQLRVGRRGGGFLPNGRQIKRETSYFSSRFQAGEREKERRFLAHGSGIMGKKRDRWKEKKRRRLMREPAAGSHGPLGSGLRPQKSSGFTFQRVALEADDEKRKKGKNYSQKKKKKLEAAPAFRPSRQVAGTV